MPKIVKEIIVKASLDDTWALVSDMERFSLCIPGCKEVKKISETEFDWKLETKVLRTTRKAQIRTRAIVKQAPTHSEFVGEGRLFERSNHYKLTIKGTADLEVISDTETKIKYVGDVKASGIGGAIIEKVAAGQMDGLFQEFENNIKQTLGDTDVTVSGDEIEQTDHASVEKYKFEPVILIGVIGVVVIISVLYYLLR